MGVGLKTIAPSMLRYQIVLTHLQWITGEKETHNARAKKGARVCAAFESMLTIVAKNKFLRVSAACKVIPLFAWVHKGLPASTAFL